MLRFIKRTQPMYKHVLWMLLVVIILLAACVPIEIVIATPQPTIAISNTAYYTPEPTLTIMPIPTRTLISLPPTWTYTPYPPPTIAETLDHFDIPSPILIFSPGEGAVYDIVSSELSISRMTAFDWPITAFDISHTHGRMAIGTLDGFLRIWNPDEGYNRTLDVRGEEEFPLFVENVTWSPDGKQVAYIVNRTDFGTGPNPAAEQLSGLWIYSPQDESNVQLIRNQYFDEIEDIEDIRLLRDPIWSPDGTGLILIGSFWEWFDILIFDPIAQDLEGETLIDPLEDLWMDASWSLDGKSIYISGRAFATTGGLYRVNRKTLEAELIFDGEEVGMIVAYARELPDGIAFIAWDDGMLPALYIGNEIDSGFRYAPIDEQWPLCDFAIFNSVEWNPAGEFLLVSCNDEWRFLSLGGGVNVDLAPYLEDLISDGELELHWDYNPEVERLLP